MRIVVGAKSEGEYQSALMFLARLQLSNGDLEAVRACAAGSGDAYFSFGGGNVTGGPLRCLFATDHSSFTDCAFEAFSELQPNGIEELTIFTAIEPTRRMEVANLHRHLSDSVAHEFDARALAQKSEALAKRLSGQGIPASTRLRTGLVLHLIEEAIAETRSELLIIGARGQSRATESPFGLVATAIQHATRIPVLVLPASGS